MEALPRIFVHRKSCNEMVEAMTHRKFTFEASESAGEVSGLFERPDSARWLYVLAHGAGAGMTHAFMEMWPAVFENWTSPPAASTSHTWNWKAAAHQILSAS